MKNLKNITSTIFCLLILLMFAGNSFAIPAFPKPVMIKQSNGKVLTYQIYGDEHINFAKTLDGYTLVADNNGDMVYAIIDRNGDMVASNIIASNQENRSDEELEFVVSLDKNIFYSSKQISKFNKQRELKNKLIKKSKVKSLTTKKPHLLVVLVNYADVTFDSANAVNFKHQIQDSNYTSNGYRGSVRDYFADNSFNEIDPQFDVYGPITLPHNRLYYAQNGNAYAWQMARDAANIIDTMYNVDFSIYDNDGDNNVDLIHIIYAGIGANSTNQKNQQVWPHMFYFQDYTTIDNKKFYRYACSSELTIFINKYDYKYVMDGIGAVCHEMSHAFGLPDLYDTDYQPGSIQAVHPASWDVMAAGPYNNHSKTPPYYSMIERDMIGWGNVVNLTDGEKLLYPIADSNTAYKVHLNENEYLMIEYRNHDKWDAYIPGIGMIIWHADTSQFVNWEMSNNVNADENDRGCYIECAGSESYLESQSTPFPGSLNKTFFDSFTLTDGTEVEGKITDIHYDQTEDSTIIFNYSSFDFVKFNINTNDITQYSAKFVGNIECETNISDIKLEYRPLTQTTYNTINLTSNTISYTLNNLEVNTQYEYRFSAKADGKTYYSKVKTFRTLCNDGVISEFPWKEGFEYGIECWLQEGSNAKWRTENKLMYSGQQVAQSYEGSYFAIFTVTAQSYSTIKNRLISPKIDISSLDTAILSFATMPLSTTSAALTVAYRLSETDNWKTLSTYKTKKQGQSLVNQWQYDSIILPEKSSCLQISFLAADNYGLGVLIDDICIKNKNNTSYLNNIVDNEDNISIIAIPNPTTADAKLILKANNCKKNNNY